MSTSYERTFRAEVLKEELGKVSADFFNLNTKNGEKLGYEIGILANKLLYPEYDNDETLNEVEKKYKEYITIYKKMKKGE